MYAITRLFLWPRKQGSPPSMNVLSTPKPLSVSSCPVKHTLVLSFELVQGASASTTTEKQHMFYRIYQNFYHNITFQEINNFKSIEYLPGFLQTPDLSPNSSGLVKFGSVILLKNPFPFNQ